jgi:GntR family transcriptional regulator
MEVPGMKSTLPIHISESSREPIYHQIEQQIKALILSGSLPAGTPLPSIRQLGTDLKCSVITTRRAYQNLEAEGYIKTRQGKGTFVSEIDEQKREQMQDETVYEAFEQAIRKGWQAYGNEEDIRQLFEDVLRDVVAKQEG